MSSPHPRNLWIAPPHTLPKHARMTVPHSPRPSPRQPPQPSGQLRILPARNTLCEPQRPTALLIVGSRTTSALPPTKAAPSQPIQQAKTLKPMTQPNRHKPTARRESKPAHPLGLLHSSSASSHSPSSSSSSFFDATG